MNRWKREAKTTLIVMHAHNQWSCWYDAMLEAAGELGLLVGYETYPNCSGDGSMDREWYVSTPMLERAGGMANVQELAREKHFRMMGVSA